MATSLGTTLNALTEPADNYVVQVANNEILGLHATLEATADGGPLSGTIHGLTNAGETLGLGYIGGDNLITDVTHAPGDILNGESPSTVIGQIVMDAGETIQGVGGLVEGVGADLHNPNIVPDLVDAATDLVNDLSGALPTGSLGDLGGLGNIGGLGDLGGLGGLDNLGGLGGLLGGGDNGGSGADDALISVSAGETGGTPIVDLGVLHPGFGDTPIGVAIGTGDNILDVGALNEDGLLSLNGGTGGAGPLSDLLSFPDLGGTGTDALSGIVPSGLGGLDLGGLTDGILGGVGGTDGGLGGLGGLTGPGGLLDITGITTGGSTSVPSEGAPLLDVHLNNALPLYINPTPQSLLGFDGSTIL